VVCVEFVPSESRKYGLDVSLRVDLNSNKLRLVDPQCCVALLLRCVLLPIVIISAQTLSQVLKV
jgi:hypothetical protein